MVKEIISKQDPVLPERYYNEITHFMDQNNIHVWNSKTNKLIYAEYGIRTYCMIDPNPKIFIIRLPGATMGHIATDDNHIITDIYLYDGVYNRTGIGYKNELKETVKKYIGYCMKI